MSNTQGTRQSFRPDHMQDYYRNHPAKRQGSAEHRGDYRSPDLAVRTVARRQESLSTQWETHFYDTTILPMQLFNEPGRMNAFGSGAQRLMFAVLQDAVSCWFRWRGCRTARSRRLFQETYDWFWATNSSGLYSFERICEVLNLEPGYIRRGLMRWQPNAQEQQTPPGIRKPAVLTRRTVIAYPAVLRPLRLTPRRNEKRPH